jgi:PAS domain-containing protein
MNTGTLLHRHHTGAEGKLGLAECSRPRSAAKSAEQWNASLAMGQMFDMEFPLRGADRIFRPLLTHVLPLKDAAGNILQWFGTNTDITERKKAEEMLKLKLEELTQSNEEL